MKLALLAIVAVSAAVGLLAFGVPRQRNGPSAKYDPSAAAKDLSFNLARVKQDPGGAIGWSQLAGSYLRLSTQHDDNEAAIKAEQAARKSLALRRSNNLNGAVRLAQSLLAQHRFKDALSACDEACRIGSDIDSAHELRADILIELGRYEEAKKELEKYHLAGLSADAVAARLALAEGRNELALKLLAGNAEKADRNWDMDLWVKAWHHEQYGHALAMSGATREAADEFRTATEFCPEDFKAWAGLARLAAARSDFRQAKELAEKSIAITPTVDAASLLEDIAIQDHDTEGAAKYRTLVDKVSHPDFYASLADPSKAQPAKAHTHDRLYANYLSDHGRNTVDAEAAARADFAIRKDIYAFDTLAWALHVQGQDREAEPLAERALARGTKDPKIAYHAGLIALALNDRGSAKSRLLQAKEFGAGLMPSDRAQIESLLNRVAQSR